MLRFIYTLENDRKKIKKVSRCGVRVIVLVTLWAYGLMAQ